MGKRGKKKAAVSDAGTPVEKNICFVIMPFGGWLDDYYKSIYIPAIDAAGLEPHRADDLFRPSTIVNDIWAYTKRAKVLLADLTDKNANVFYELGLAHALAKPAILVAETMDDIPFDLRALRVILYDKNAPNWGELLRQKIESSLKEILAAPADAILPAFLDVRSAGQKPIVSPEQKELIEIKQELDLLRREFRVGEMSKLESRRGNYLNASQARELLQESVNEGLPDDLIVNRLVRRGAPRDWVTRRLREMRPLPGAEDSLQQPGSEKPNPG